MMAVFSFCFLASVSAQDVRIETRTDRHHRRGTTTTVIREHPGNVNVIRERSYHGYYRRPHTEIRQERIYRNDYDNINRNRDYENYHMDKDGDLR